MSSDSHPFFGPLSEGMCFAEFELVSADTCALRSLEDALIAARRANLRCAIGFSPGFYDRFPVLKRPRGFRALRINGDVAFGLYPERRKDILVTLAGDWIATVENAKALVADLNSKEFRLVRADFGHHQGTLRDYSGFLDGTSNLQDLSLEQLDICTRVQATDDNHYRGSSFVLIRKYVEDLEMWNDLPDSVQEQFIGRKKNTGTYLDGNTTWSPRVWDVTPPLSHIRCANPEPCSRFDWKRKLYRRSIKWLEQTAPGRVDYGLLFVAVMRDPVEQFEKPYNHFIHPSTGPRDMLLTSGYVRPLSSGLYVIPSGSRSGQLLGGEDARTSQCNQW